MKNKNRIPLELYIHIPFCVQKCQYCDFLSGPSDQETRDRYIKALRAEIQAVQGVEAYEIVSVFPPVLWRSHHMSWCDHKESAIKFSTRPAGRKNRQDEAVG